MPVLSAACGDGHTLAVRSDGSVWAFGKHEDGQLGVRGMASLSPALLSFGLYPVRGRRSRCSAL